MEAKEVIVLILDEEGNDVIVREPQKKVRELTLIDTNKKEEEEEEEDFLSSTFSNRDQFNLQNDLLN